MPSDAEGATPALVTYAVSRRQGHLLELSQPAWQPQSEAINSADGNGELFVLPYRAARTVSLGTSSGDGELRELSRAAWNQQPTVAESTNATGVRFLSRHEPASDDSDVVERRSRFQSGVHQLSFEDPWFESPIRQLFPALGGDRHEKKDTGVHQCNWPLHARPWHRSAGCETRFEGRFRSGKPPGAARSD